MESGNQAKCNECDEIFTLKYEFMSKDIAPCPKCGTPSSMAEDYPKPLSPIIEADSDPMKQILFQLKKQADDVRTIKNIAVAYAFVLAIGFIYAVYLSFSLS